MFVKLAVDGSVSLEDRDNFRAFKLVIEGGTEAARAGAPRARQHRRAGRRQPRLDLRAGAAAAARGGRRRRAGAESFSAMIEKARPHGWIDEQRKAIKAHIEWTEKA